MSENEVVILVETDEPGIAQVSISDFTEEQVQKSKEAIGQALQAIEWVAEKTAGTLGKLHQRPDEVELEFGIKVGSKASVLVVQADAEFHIKAKLIWKKSPGD